MSFKSEVINIVNKIPSGKVSTYGAVAALAGSPGSARYVGFILAGLTLAENQIPWWRVVNHKGYLSINHGSLGIEKERQRDLLLEEGVEVSTDYMLELEKYLWDGLD